jgi:hypothetical protein
MGGGFLSSNPVTNMHYSDQPYSIYQAFGSLTKIAGSHTLKFGGEHRVMDFTNLSCYRVDGFRAPPTPRASSREVFGWCSRAGVLGQAGRTRRGCYSTPCV